MAGLVGFQEGGGARRTTVKHVSLAVFLSRLVRSVRYRVDETASLAELARQKNMGGVDEESRGSNEQDVATKVHALAIGMASLSQGANSRRGSFRRRT